MKAEELRINNFVNVFGIPEVVTRRMINRIAHIQEMGKICIDVTPIELTEDWLVRLGFVKIENRHQYGWYKDVDRRSLCWCFSEFISMEFKPGQCDEWNDTIFDVPCKHVHQLQNLYFALTSTELNIKE